MTRTSIALSKDIPAVGIDGGPAVILDQSVGRDVQNDVIAESFLAMAEEIIGDIMSLPLRKASAFGVRKPIFARIAHFVMDRGCLIRRPIFDFAGSEIDSDFPKVSSAAENQVSVFVEDAIDLCVFPIARSCFNLDVCRLSEWGERL